MTQPPACPTCSDAWTWVVTYINGQRVEECSPGHPSFGSVDTAQVESLTWRPTRPGLPVVSVQIATGEAKPVLFRRHLIEVQFSATSGVLPQAVIHCLGWERQLTTGETIGSYTFAFEDGLVLTSADRNCV